jgi:hypothetical protein
VEQPVRPVGGHGCWPVGRHTIPSWNPAVEDQATDRAHRIGQDKPVFVYKLVVQGTVEAIPCIPGGVIYSPATASLPRLGTASIGRSIGVIEGREGDTERDVAETKVLLHHARRRGQIDPG